MRQSTNEWTVRMLTDLRERIDTESEYQRGQVWSVAQQRLLIDSLLRGYDIPKIYLRKRPEGGSRLYEVVDGKQRLTAIWRFLGNDFRLSRDVYIEGIGQLGGKTWSELSAAAQDRLQFATITVSQLEEATSDEVAELFLRLQKGEPLRAAEKRNAILGPVRDFVANDLATLPVFPHLGIPNRRFTWHELAAIALLLTIREAPTTLKGADLNDLYENRSFDPNGEKAELTIHWLSQLDVVAQQSPGVITTRWGFVDLLLCLMRLEQEGQSWTGQEVMGFFIDFEAERKDAATRLAEFRDEMSEIDPSEMDVQEAARELPALNPDMFSYVQAFSREGATEENVRVRSEVMYRRLATRLAGRAEG
jgi:hypothetical protein